MTNYKRQLFEVVTGTTVTGDVLPEISIDFETRLVDNINRLREILGITYMIPMANGSQVKTYKTAVTVAENVAEGEVINLSKVTRKLAKAYDLTLKKYGKMATAELIQKAGVNRAVNDTDSALLSEIQKDVKKSFFTTIGAGEGTYTGAKTFQATLANAWAAVQGGFEDIDATPVFFVNPVDLASHLGTATISTQNAFGLNYIENFMGLGTVIVSAAVTAGTIVATAKENLNGAYVPANGDVAESFGLTYDESGLVGMKHSANDERASIYTLIMSAVLFYAEDPSKVYVGTITAA